MPGKGKGNGPEGENGGRRPGKGEEKGGAARGKRRKKGRRRSRPERWQEVEALVRRLEPEIVQLFRRHQVDPNVASLVLEEVVVLLLYRWGQIAHPEAWVLEMLERRIERQKR